jgi:hypothetical protein
MSVLCPVLLGAGVLHILSGCGDSPPAPPPVPVEDASDEGGTAPPVDAGVPVEDARDARADAPSAGFCASRSPAPKFCDDFDDDDLEDDWAVLTAQGGEAVLDPSVAVSPPASLAVGTAGLGAMQNANVHLRATANGAPTGHVVLAFEMMLATTAYTQGAIAVATLDVSSSHFFTLYLRDGDTDAPAATLEEITQSGTTRHVLSKLPGAGVWTHVTIDVDIGGAKASVSWGNEKVLDATTTPGPAQDPTIRIGAVYVNGPAAPFEARFDDVTLDF